MIKRADTLYKAGDGRGNPSGRYSSCCNRTPVDGSAGVPEKFSGNGLCTDIEWSKDCPYAGWERSYGAASESG